MGASPPNCRTGLPWEVGPNQACDPLPFFNEVQAAGYPYEVPWALLLEAESCHVNAMRSSHDL